MGIEAVSHCSDHYPGDEDHHSEGDDAAVARELSTPGSGHQLDLSDHGDRGEHNFALGVLLHCPWLGRLWSSKDLLDGLFSHFYSGVSWLSSQTRLRGSHQDGSSHREAIHYQGNHAAWKGRNCRVSASPGQLLGKEPVTARLSIK